MKITRIISVIMAAIMICCLMTACGPDNSGSAGSGDGNNSAASGGGGGSGSDSSSNVSDNNEKPAGGGNTDGAGNNGDNGSNGDSNDNGGGEDGNNGDSSPGSQGLTGTPAEILSKLIEDLTAAGVEMPMSIPPMEVSPDMSQNTIGLSEGDFDKYVADSAYTMAAIGTFPHQIIIVQAVDERSAGEIKKLVTGDNGYDAKKWICVFPETAIAVESGVYVLILAAKAAVADAAVEAFKDAAGTIGDVDTFWEFAGEADTGGGGGLSLG